MSFNIIPVAGGYQEIHLYSGMNIDNVKINTSLIMMKECMVFHCIILHSIVLHLIIVVVHFDKIIQ